jgi:hypothetical protein
MKTLKESINLDHLQDHLSIQQFLNSAKLPYFEVQKIFKFLNFILKTLSFKCSIFGYAISNSIYGAVSIFSVNKNEPLSKVHQFYGEPKK